MAWNVSGSGTLGTSFTAANLFTVSGSGNFDISQIDLGVNYVAGTNTFYASICPNAPDAPPMPEFPIPFLEDAAAIHIGYMQALYGITNHRLDPRQARLVLAALNGARTNLKQMEACVTACAKATSDKNKRKPPASVKSAGVTRSSARSAKARMSLYTISMTLPPADSWIFFVRSITRRVKANIDFAWGDCSPSSTMGWPLSPPLRTGSRVV